MLVRPVVLLIGLSLAGPAFATSWLIAPPAVSFNANVAAHDAPPQGCNALAIGGSAAAIALVLPVVAWRVRRRSER